MFHFLSSCEMPSDEEHDDSSGASGEVGDSERQRSAASTLTMADADAEVEVEAATIHSPRRSGISFAEQRRRLYNHEAVDDNDEEEAKVGAWDEKRPGAAKANGLRKEEKGEEETWEENRPSPPSTAGGSPKKSKAAAKDPPAPGSAMEAKGPRPTQDGGRQRGQQRQQQQQQQQRRQRRERPRMVGSVVGKALVGSVVVRERPQSPSPDGGRDGDDNGGDGTAGNASIRPAMTRRQMSQRNLFRFSQYTDDDMKHMMSIFKRRDEESGTKTWTRKLVETTLSKFKWYNPQRDVPDAPSLSKAWCYYEHVTLARRLTSSGDGYHRAEPGDTARTELYGPFETPESALSEWGVGVALYFSTVRVMAAILFLTGIINIANIEYYSSSEYNAGGKGDLPTMLLRGTAICTDREWVVCSEGCTLQRWEDGEDGFATGTDPTTGDDLTFVKRTMCNGAQLPQGMVSYGSLFFLALCFVLLGGYQHVQENWLDEDNVMSSDYTVRVANPPGESYDPDKWKDYFEQFTEKGVAAVTIVLDNEALLSALVQRRVFTEQLRLLLSGDVDMDDSSRVEECVEEHIRDRDCDAREVSWWGCDRVVKVLIRRLFNLFGYFLPAEKLLERIEHWTDKVKDAQKAQYKVVNVFVSFETQKDQRLALEATSVSKIERYMWKKKKQNDTVETLDGKVLELFEGKLLNINEPQEPSTIRYLDLHVSAVKKAGLWLLTLAVIAALMAAADHVFRPVRDYSIILYSACVSAVDCVIPDFVLVLMSLEKHNHEGSYETSLYFKITVFRCFILVILPVIITPFTHTLGVERGDLLYTTNALLFSDMLGTPLYRLMDPMGVFRKHILGPRATTQELMNSNFTGTNYHLGERYTDLTKTVFLILFYSALDPRSFFIGSAALIVQYCTDKFCLMRLWSTAPFIGTKLSRSCRRYFYGSAVLVMAVISSRVFAQFPMDNICDSENPVGGFSGDYNVTVAGGDGSSEIITVSQDSEVIFCNQELDKLEGTDFPATPEVQEGSQGRWMNESQETLTRIYGWTAFGVVIAYSVLGFGLVLGNRCRSIYKKTGPRRRDRDNDTDFTTTNLGVQAYIPHVKHPTFDFPLLACDIDDIDQKLIGWNDPIHSYDFHNLIFDVPWAGMKRSKRIMTNTRGAATLSRHKDYRADRVDVTCQASPSAGEGTEVSIGLQGDSSASETPQGNSPIFSILKYYPSGEAEKSKNQSIFIKVVDKSDGAQTPVLKNGEKRDSDSSSNKSSFDRNKASDKADTGNGLDYVENFFDRDHKFGSWSDSYELQAPSRSMDKSNVGNESCWENEIEITQTQS